MQILKHLLSRLRALFRKSRFEADMVEEMQAHFEMQEAANRAEVPMPRAVVVGGA